MIGHLLSVVDWLDVLFGMVSVVVLVTFALFMLLVLPRVDAAYTCEDVSQEFLFVTTTAEAPEWCEQVAR